MGTCTSHGAPTPVYISAPVRSALKYPAVDVPPEHATFASRVRGHSEASTASRRSSDRRGRSVAFSQPIGGAPRDEAYVAEGSARRGLQRRAPPLDPFAELDMGPPPPPGARQLSPDDVMVAA
jgi:hypothetical protein